MQHWFPKVIREKGYSFWIRWIIRPGPAHAFWAGFSPCRWTGRPFHPKLTHFCLACRFPPPSQRPIVGRCPASPALKQGQVEAGNRAPPLLSICAWFARLPSQVSVAETVVLSACLRAPVADPTSRAARHEGARSENRPATSAHEPASGECARRWPRCAERERPRRGGSSDSRARYTPCSLVRRSPALATLS